MDCMTYQLVKMEGFHEKIRRVIEVVDGGSQSMRLDAYAGLCGQNPSIQGEGDQLLVPSAQVLYQKHEGELMTGENGEMQRQLGCENGRITAAEMQRMPGVWKALSVDIQSTDDTMSGLALRALSFLFSWSKDVVASTDSSVLLNILMNILDIISLSQRHRDIYLGLVCLESLPIIEDVHGNLINPILNSIQRALEFPSGSDTIIVRGLDNIHKMLTFFPSLMYKTSKEKWLPDVWRLMVHENSNIRKTALKCFSLAEKEISHAGCGIERRVAEELSVNLRSRLEGLVKSSHNSDVCDGLVAWGNFIRLLGHIVFHSKDICNPLLKIVESTLVHKSSEIRTNAHRAWRVLMTVYVSGLGELRKEETEEKHRITRRLKLMFMPISHSLATDTKFFETNASVRREAMNTWKYLIARLEHYLPLFTKIILSVQFEKLLGEKCLSKQAPLGSNQHNAAMEAMEIVLFMVGKDSSSDDSIQRVPNGSQSMSASDCMETTTSNQLSKECLSQILPILLEVPWRALALVFQPDKRYDASNKDQEKMKRSIGNTAYRCLQSLLQVLVYAIKENHQGLVSPALQSLSAFFGAINNLECGEYFSTRNAIISFIKAVLSTDDKKSVVLEEPSPEIYATIQSSKPSELDLIVLERMTVTDFLFFLYLQKIDKPPPDLLSNIEVFCSAHKSESSTVSNLAKLVSLTCHALKVNHAHDAWGTIWVYLVNKVKVYLVENGTAALKQPYEQSDSSPEVKYRAMYCILLSLLSVPYTKGGEKSGIEEKVKESWISLVNVAREIEGVESMDFPFTLGLFQHMEKATVAPACYPENIILTLGWLVSQTFRSDRSMSSLILPAARVVSSLLSICPNFDDSTATQTVGYLLVAFRIITSRICTLDIFLKYVGIMVAPLTQWMGVFDNLKESILKRLLIQKFVEGWEEVWKVTNRAEEINTQFILNYHNLLKRALKHSSSSISNITRKHVKRSLSKISDLSGNELLIVDELRKECQQGPGLAQNSPQKTNTVPNTARPSGIPKDQVVSSPTHLITGHETPDIVIASPLLDSTVDKQTRNRDNVPISSFSEINSHGNSQPSEKANNQDIEGHLESAPDPNNLPHDTPLVAPSSPTITESPLITLESQGNLDQSRVDEELRKLSLGDLLNQCNIIDKGTINIFLLRNIGTAKDLGDLDSKELLNVVSPEILSKLQRKIESLVQPHESSYKFLQHKVASRAAKQDKAESSRKRSRSRGEEILSAINNLGEKPGEKANASEPLVMRKKKRTSQPSQNLEPHQDNSCHHLEVALDSLQENPTPDEPNHISNKSNLEAEGNGHEENGGPQALERAAPTIQRKVPVVEIAMSKDCNAIKLDQQREAIPPTPQFGDTDNRKVTTDLVPLAIANSELNVKVEDTVKNKKDALISLESSTLPGSLSLEQILTEERLMTCSANELVNAMHRITTVLQRKLHST